MKRTTPARATVLLHRMAPKLASELRAVLGRRYLNLREAAQKSSSEHGDSYDNSLVVDDAVVVDWHDLSTATRERLVSAGMKEGDFEVDTTDLWLDAYFKEGRTAGVEFTAFSRTTRVAEADMMPLTLVRQKSSHGHLEEIGTGKGESRASGSRPSR